MLRKVIEDSFDLSGDFLLRKKGERQYYVARGELFVNEDYLL